MQAPDNFNPTPGKVYELSEGVQRILCPNPSPMTYRGTNTYLIGTRDLAVIDPGPNDNSHLKAILAAVKPAQRITHIIVTHAHMDHSPLARPLAQACGAQVYGFGPAQAGRSQAMQQLVDQGMTGGGEGIDNDFFPDVAVKDGDILQGSDWNLEVIHTPGHLGNHIALALGDICFTADHIMGWASSLVSPPDGDLTDFMASCHRLRARNWSVFHPGHGAPVDNPAERLDWLMSHRMSRETAILDALQAGPATAQELAQQIYTETPPALLPAAERNVLAHLVDLLGRSIVHPTTAFSQGAAFALKPEPDS